MTGDLAALTTLRRSEDRRDEREGIPMVLALVSAAREIPDPPDADILAEGARLASGLDALRAELAPSQRDDDMGCVLTLARALAYEDFGDE